MFTTAPVVTRITLLVAVVSTAIACNSASDNGPVRSRLPSILIISIDTLRADHLGCYGYDPYEEPVSPRIDRLASQGVIFKSYFAPRGQTEPSLSSMMTGRFPSAHGVRENGQHMAEGQHTLAELLLPLGYDTAAFLSRIRATPQSNPARGANKIEFGRFHGASTRADRQNAADADVTDMAIAWLGEKEPGAPDPFFAWVHLFAVHKPYAPPPPYDTLFSGDYSGALRPATRTAKLQPEKILSAIDSATLEGRRLSEADHQYVLSLYDGGIRATDDHVGRILDSLDKRGLADETIVVLTADHGEELGDHHGYYYHGNSIYDGTLRIPLIIRWPRHLKAGGEFEHLAQNVDLVPTLLDWLEVEIPKDIEGVSLTPWLSETSQPSDQPRKYAFIEWQDTIWSVRTDAYKYVFNPRGVHPKKAPYFGGRNNGFPIACVELYGLSTDPLEQRNRVSELLDEEVELREVIRSHSTRSVVVTNWEALDDQALDQLQALGYVGSQSDRSDVIFGAEVCDSYAEPKANRDTEDQ